AAPGCRTAAAPAGAEPVPAGRRRPGRRRPLPRDPHQVCQAVDHGGRRGHRGGPCPAAAGAARGQRGRLRVR
ncbi:unnamed protein product, partial [Prorocentrum cordatum]